MKYIKLIVLFILLSLAENSRAQENGRLLLFSEEIKAAYPSVVYDFLERYLMEVSSVTPGITLNQKLADDKVRVTEGSLSNIHLITQETPFSMSRIEDKYYEVSWQTTDGQVLLTMTFPIQYELLLGKQRTDIEKELMATMLECQPVDADTTSYEVEAIGDGYYRSVPTSFYYIGSMTTARYFSVESDSTVIPVYADSLRWYSCANMMMGLIDSCCLRPLYIQQNMYGYRTQNYTITLGNWLSYCKQNNITLYFTVEEEREDGIKALLIAQSRDLGFNHLMTLLIPSNFITKSDAIIKAKLNAYIPTQNVKDLYLQYKKSNKHSI